MIELHESKFTAVISINHNLLLDHQVEQQKIKFMKPHYLDYGFSNGHKIYIHVLLGNM